MEPEKGVALICCYGPVDSRRSKVELDGLRAYFMGVAEWLSRHPEIKRAWLLGGVTEACEHDYSEAKSSLGLFRACLRDVGHSVEVFLEERSMTTEENLIFARQALRGENYFPCRVAIFADTARRMKVDFLGWLLFRRTGYRTVGIKRSDDNRRSSRPFQALSLLKTVLTAWKTVRRLDTSG